MLWSFVIKYNVGDWMRSEYITTAGKRYNMAHQIYFMSYVSEYFT